jgi:hypothetical protein
MAEFLCVDTDGAFLKVLRVERSWRGEVRVADWLLTESKEEFLNYVREANLPVHAFLPGYLASARCIILPFGGSKGYKALQLELEDSDEILPSDMVEVWVPKRAGTSFIFVTTKNAVDEFISKFFGDSISINVLEYKPSSFLRLKRFADKGNIIKAGGFLEVSRNVINAALFADGKYECISAIVPLEDVIDFVLMFIRAFETKYLGTESIERIWAFGDGLDDSLLGELERKSGVDFSPLYASSIVGFEKTPYDSTSNPDDILVPSVSLAVRDFVGSGYPSVNFIVGGRKTILDTIQNISKIAYLPSIVLFISSFVFFLSASFERSKLENTVTQYNLKMEETFKEAIPDVKKIVDPYLQMKQRVDGILKRGRMEPAVDIIYEFLKSVSGQVTSIEELIIDENSVRVH